MPKKVQSDSGNEGIIAKGQGYLKFGNIKKAEEYANEALAIKPSLESYLFLLDVYKEKKDEAIFRGIAKDALEQITDPLQRSILYEKIDNI